MTRVPRGPIVAIGVAVLTAALVLAGAGAAAAQAAPQTSQPEVVTDQSGTRVVAAETVDVRPSQVEVAERQIQEQVQQRVLGVVPNFYLSFVPNAAPLNTTQKFKLSWRATIDPFQFAGVAAIAGIQQARDQFPGFGGGWSGYAKRYGAAYAAETTQRMFTRMVMPSIFRQDPRYFYKGGDDVRARVLYALSRSVVRRGDNGRPQPNYSTVLGSFSAAAVSNLYYPEEDRHGLTLTLQNVALGLAFNAGGNVAQEFLWSRLTSRPRARQP